MSHCDGCASREEEIENLHREMRQLQHIRAQETMALQAQVKELMDPIFRAKMMEPAQPWISICKHPECRPERLRREE